ncbi:bleomycin resistance protein [Rhizobium sp. YTU87027]|uniref:bleomycin resistance protein n=1 Tax=Rhizobium sp. YTU87027 TaxID=3417741 RepID=UPI003D696FF9
MPNIENLKKQAKTYLRWHREQYFPVAAQIRWILPRYRDQSDRAIMDADFRLSDTQELAARKHGFANWPALVEGIETMTKSTVLDSRRPLMLSAEPQLFVSDINASSQFYVRKLGFEIAFLYGEPPFYAQVFRGGARLNLRKVGAPVFDTGFRAREVDALSATLTVDDPKQLFLEYRAADASFHQPLRNEPWGARTFIVQDPDGNLIAFSGTAP